MKLYQFNLKKIANNRIIFYFNWVVFVPTIAPLLLLVIAILVSAANGVNNKTKINNKDDNKATNESQNIDMSQQNNQTTTINTGQSSTNIDGLYQNINNRTNINSMPLINLNQNSRENQNEKL